jgi:hypothetical protein
VLVLPLVREIALSGQPLAAKVVVSAICLLIITIAAWAPLVAAVLWPQRADRVLGSLNTFVTAHEKVIGGVVTVAFGIYLAVKGLAAI